MPRASVRLVCLAALAAATCSGCASGRVGGGNPFARRNTTVGTLKASLAQVESEKEQYRKEVAELERDNRRLSERLAEERNVNGELTARLDDARNVIGRTGLDTSVPARSSASASNRSSTTTPASGRRSPPFTQISGGERALPPTEKPRDSGYADDLSSRTNDEDLPAPTRSARIDEPDEPSPGRWLPVVVAPE